MSRDTSQRMPVRLDVTMSLATGMDGRHWHLRFSDSDSRIVLLEVEMTPEQFGLAVGHMGLTEVSGVLASPERILEVAGLVRENMTLLVPIKRPGSDMEALRKAADASTPEGWTRSDSLLSWNNHRVAGNAYRVSYHRHVARGEGGE